MFDIHLDCHMHSIYSDGRHTIDDVAQSALEKGLTTIAVTDHMPLPYPTRYAMDRDLLPAYREAIGAARLKYGDRLTILAGLEMEYIPEHREWIKDIADLGWDLLLISIHGIVTHEGHFMVNGREDEFQQTLDRVFAGDIRAFCTRYYALIREAVATGWFDVAGHLDVIKKHNLNNRYFDETASWYRDQVIETLDALADSHVKLEINTNGLNHQAAAPYPGPWIIREAIARGISLVLGSDAHSPKFQGQYFDQISSMIAPG